MAERVIRIVLTGDSAGAVHAMASTEAAATKTEGALGRVHRAGQKMSSVGMTMTKIAVPLLALGGYAVKTASQFQDSMTLLRTQVGASAGEVSGMQASIMKLAPKVGEGPNALAQALYPIESVGLRGAAALDALKAAAMGAQVSGASLTDTADAISGALKTQLHDVHSAADAMAIMNVATAQGKMHLQDLVGAMSTGILPAAKNVGLGFRDVAGALAAMTRQGIPADVAASRLRMTLTQMTAPHGQALKAFASIGLSQFQLADDMRKRNGLITALADLRAHLQAIPQDQRNLVISEAFGGGRSSANVVSLMNALPMMRQIQQPLAAAGTAQLQQAFGIRTKDISFQWQQLKATAQVALIGIGNALMPIVVQYLPKLAHLIADVAHWFTHLSKPVKDVILGFTLFMAIGGPIIAFMGTLVTAITGVGSALMFLWANPVFLVIGAIVALGVALVVAYNRVAWFRNFVNGAFAAIKNVVVTVVGFIRAHWQLLVSILTGPFGAVAVFVGTHFNDIKSIVSGIVDSIKSTWNALTDILTWPFKQLLKAVNAVLGPIEKVLDDVGRLNPFHGQITAHVIHQGSAADTAAAWAEVQRQVGWTGMPIRQIGRQSQSVGSQPANSVNQTGHTATPPAHIVLHHTTRIGQRVVAEETVHYGAKRSSLGAAVLAH